MSEEDGVAEPEPYTLERMLAHRRAFLQAISRSFPLAPEALERHADVLDWRMLCSNAHLDWSLALLERHAWRWWDMTLPIGLWRVSLRLRSAAPFESLCEFRGSDGSEEDWTAKRLHELRAELAAGKTWELGSFTPLNAGADTPAI
ncbi:MAG: hypothetical protein KC457_20175, partial [Myxococcales bacterium]|nr:hypothetical protein [Myxococcales bacterium]